MSAVPAASLSAALLVTKGNAQPSRGLAQPMTERPELGARDASALGPTPIARALPPAFAAPPAVAGATGRLTLRVDEKQRLRLRLASAHLGKSRQTILLEALDHYLKRVLPGFLHDPCPCIQGESAIDGDCCRRSDTDD